VKRISIFLVGLLAIVLAACSSGQGSSASASASAEPTPTATEEATPEATESAEPDASGSEMAIPSFDLNGDPELADRIPDTVDGQPLQVFSFRGDVFMSQGADPEFQAFLDSVDADLEDVSVAVGGVASGESYISVTAFRVLGVSEDRLREEFLSAAEGSGDVSGFENATLAGKSVYVAPDPTGELGGVSFYLYTKDDTIYWMTGTEAQVTQILEALP
jgi:hypothetical protein